MKKTSILLSLMAAGAMAFGQTTRLSLYEEFTGENCGPCASTNPGLQVKLDANTTKMTSIKWEVPIPSAPTPTWSLYKTNQTEIDWRYKSTTAGGYGYPSQNTSTNTISSGINSAPSGRIDGQHQWTFGATSDHPFYMSNTVINTAQAVTSPFTVLMNRQWDPTFTAVTVTVDITAAQNFTAVGNLVFRLVLVEQEIHFATAPGTNGEKDFYNVARKSYPNIQNGTALPATWTTGQNQTFTVNCVLPSYIVDKSMVNFIGFIQDDGDRKVHQAAKTTTVGIPDDGAVAMISGAYLTCGSSYSPNIVVKNNGSTTITTMTINPYLNGAPQTQFVYTGSIAPGATVAVTMPVISAPNGSNTYSVNISSVNGNVDSNPANNSKSAAFAMVSTYSPPPVTEAYTAVTFPPANWFMYNGNGGTATWLRSGTVGGYGTGLGSAKYDFYNNSSVGDADDLYLPAQDFSAATNPVLSFDVAYAGYTTGANQENDQLDVMVSTNCGATWTSVYSKAGSTLQTANPTTSAFNPTSTQWRTDVVNLSSYAGMPNVLVKFVATSDYGNNLYLDNINLSNSTGIKSAEQFGAISMYPNPAQTETNVKIDAVESGDVTISVVNSLGQTVSVKKVAVETGSNTVNIETKNFAAGIYNVVIDTPNGSTVKKLTVSK
jgi:hypothetical protein